jgi:ParB family chromosome partitioning protein
LETTAESVAKQFGVNEKTIRRDGQLAEAVEVLGITEDYTKGQIKATASEVVEAAKPIVEAKKAEDRWQREVEQRPFAPPPKPTPVEPVRIEAIKEQLKTPHVARNSGDNEWYTPSVYILAAKAVFGEIDLDPASSEIANKTVGAKTFFTAEQDGLSQAWPVGRIWMNPPYAQPLISRFCERIVDEIARGSSAIVLVNNGTETQWFQGMAEECSAVCFPRSRIKFLDPEGNPGAPLQGQAVVYFGGDPDSFKEHFSQFGEVFFHG